MELPVPTPEHSELSTETRHSALLLGGALGIMITLAVLLFLATTRLAG